MNNLSKKQWALRCNSKQERFDNGRWGAIHYEMVEHEAHQHDCPPLRYDPTGKLLGKQRKTHNIKYLKRVPKKKGTVPQSWKTVETAPVSEKSESVVATVPQSWESDGLPELGESGLPELGDKLVSEPDTSERDKERNACGPPPPVHFSDKNQNHGYGKARWLPIAEMQKAVLEATGQRVWFPKSYHGKIRRLAEEYGRDEIVAAVKELLNSRSAPGQTFNWRGFAGWLLNGASPSDFTGSKLRTVLLARRLYPSNHAADQIKKAASA